MHHYYDHFFGMHFIWWIVWVVIIIWIFASPKYASYKRKKESPLDILKTRFAKGEIDKEAYEDAKKVLKEDEKSS